MADNPTVNGVIVAGDDVGSGVIVQRVKLNVGADGTGGAATDVAAAAPLPAGHHRDTAAVQIASGTISVAVADGTTQLDGPAITLPSVAAGLGGLVTAWVRNTTNQPLELRLKHTITDPNAGTTRYGTLSTVSGPAVITIPTIASESDGVVVLFDAGLLPGGGKFTLRAVAAVDATYTVSLVAWSRNV